MKLLALSLVSLLLSGLSAQEPPLSAAAFEGTWIAGAADGNGTLWARGADWKLGFTAQGEARYLPRLDAEWRSEIGIKLLAATIDGAPLPLTTAPATAVDDQRVERSLGALTEVWDLSPRAARWSFRFDRLPRLGDLEVSVAAETTLPARPLGDGIEWAAADERRITCRDAVVRDAAGRSLALELRQHGDTLRLAVPRSFLEQATWPVTVDPVMQVVNPFIAQWQQRAAAFDPLTRTWLLAAIESGDVIVHRIDEQGTVLGIHVAEGSSALAVQCDIAVNGQSGAAVVAYAETTTQRVHVRTVSPADGAMGPLVTVGNASLEAPLVELGGARTGNRFLLVTRTMTINPLRSVAARLLDLSGSVVATGNIALAVGPVSDLAVAPQAAGQWGVAWGRSGGSAGLAVDFAAIDAVENGGAPVVSPILAASTLTNNTSSLTIAGEGERLVVATERSGLVHGTVLERTAGVWQVLDAQSLSPLEYGVGVLGTFHEPRLICDGCRYSYCYEVGSEVRAATFRLLTAPVGVQVVFDETRVVVGTSQTTAARFTTFASAAASGGPAARSFVAWRLTSVFLAAQQFAFYEARTPGTTFTTIAVPCGSLGRTLLEADGSSTLGGTYTLRVSREQGLPMILAGLATPTMVPLCVGPNSTCERGVRLPAMVTVVAPTLTVRVPCGSAFLGLTLAFQAIDLAAPGGCGPGVFGVPFRVTDTILATVR